MIPVVSGVQIAYACTSLNPGCIVDAAVSKLGLVGKVIPDSVKQKFASSISSIVSKAAANSGVKAGSEAFHYTAQQWGDAIKQKGLWEGSYATPSGDLSGLGAKLELALSPTKAAPEIKITIDLDAMRKAGYEIPKPTRVSNVVTDPKTGRVYTMPGGGYEIKFPYAVPPKYIKEVQSVK